MNKFFLKIVTLTLSVLVLLSTFSFTVDRHYCGDFLVDVSFTGETEGCGMKMDKTSAIKKKNCCKDEVHQFDGQDELQNHKVENITFENQQFLTSFLISYKDLFVDNESNNSFYRDFYPPDIPKDYQVLHQTFLI